MGHKQVGVEVTLQEVRDSNLGLSTSILSEVFGAFLSRSRQMQRWLEIGHDSLLPKLQLLTIHDHLSISFDITTYTTET
jgi:hypothetical protein